VSNRPGMRGSVALVGLCALFAAGCSGGGSGGGPAAADRSAAPTTAPAGATTTTLLTDVTATTGPVGVGAGGPTTTVDVAPVRAAWERWARALASGDLAGASVASRDGANGWTAVTRVVAQSDAAAGHPHSYSGRLTGGSLRSQSGSRASLNADLAFTDRSDQFTRTVQIGEPVLDRVGADWTLVGFKIDGALIGWSAIGAERAAGDVTMQLTALLTAGTATWAITQTTSATDVSFDGAGAELTAADGRTVPWSGRAFVGTRQVTCVWRFPATARVAHAHFQLKQSDKPLDFVF
jgi:hypothetical protein